MTQWTKEPPTEPGSYWVRQMCDGKLSKPWTVTIYPNVMQPPKRGYSAYNMEDKDGLNITEEAYRDSEWWPIPIQPPEEKS